MIFLMPRTAWLIRLYQSAMAIRSLVIPMEAMMSSPARGPADPHFVWNERSNFRITYNKAFTMSKNCFDF